MADVQLSTIERLMNMVSDLGDKDFEEKIIDVLNGGPSFFEIDYQLPQQIKDIIEHPAYT